MAQGRPEKVGRFLTFRAWTKGLSLHKYLKDDAEKANLKDKRSVDELFVELKLKRDTDGLFSDPLFFFWRTCLEKFNAAHLKESQTSVVESLRTIYGDTDLVGLLRTEEVITKSAEYAKNLQNDLCAIWKSEGKSQDEILELLRSKVADDKSLEDP